MSTSSSSPVSGGASRSGPFPRRSLEIGAIVVAFIYWWPAGLALVAWKLAGYPASAEMRGLFQGGGRGGPRGASRFARAFEAAGRRSGVSPGSWTGSGNAAFDDYRRAELDRLEAQRRALQEESRAFAEFVEELKRTKDREQFDAFMAQRRAGEGGSFTA